MNKIRLRSCLFAVFSSVAVTLQATEVETLVFENDAIRAEIVPAWAGRLMFFGRKGGVNVLWTQPEAANFGCHPSGKPRWKNVGGEKTWVGSDGAAWRAFEGIGSGPVWPPPVWFDSLPMEVVAKSSTNAILRTGSHRGGDWVVALEREFILEDDALVIRSRLLTADAGANGPKVLPDDDRRLWSIAQIPRPGFVMIRLCGERRHSKFGAISAPEPDASAGWSRIAIPNADAARKISAAGDALAVRLADGEGWFLMEHTAPKQCLSAFAEPGRAMIYASPDDFKPSIYAELEFAAYGPDAEHSVRFSLPRNLP